MKNIALIGATGSIGSQTLEIISENKDICLKSISVGKNIELTKEIIRKFHPEYVSCLLYQDMLTLKDEFLGVKFGYGDDGLIQAATYVNKGDFLINAVVGMIGLKPTIEAIKKGINILLANKETLVAAGDIIKKLVKEYNVELIPIDSEHSAIFQSLKSGNKCEISKIIITASGGAFRNLHRDELKNVKVEDALKHPNWSMGAKITIDSATMVNKGLEVIEAHHLFDLNYDQIETIIHPQSIIHSLVEFKDSAIIAELSVSDMRIPIQYAITYPNRVENPLFKKLNLQEIGKLTFLKMDFDRFPMIDLAYQVGRCGGLLPAVYNKANEVAVDLFLKNKISFLEIESIITQAVQNTLNIINPDIDTIIKTCDDVSNKILEKYNLR